jgi:hypothetical protein
MLETPAAAVQEQQKLIRSPLTTRVYEERMQTPHCPPLALIVLLAGRRAATMLFTCMHIGG